MFQLFSDDTRTIRNWLGEPAGQSFVRCENQVLAAVLPRITGFRCVQIGPWPMTGTLLSRAGTLRAWSLGDCAQAGVDIRFDGQRLPLASGSIDAIVLNHGLEQADEPHRLLRECARVLSPRGQIVVAAFNPLSPWLWRQCAVGQQQRRLRPCSIAPRAARLMDWLRLLEFETDELWRYGGGFPLFGGIWEAGGARRWLQPLAWSAGAYAVVARRRVAPTARQRRASRVLKRPTPALARPAARQLPCAAQQRRDEAERRTTAASAGCNNAE